MVFKKLSRCIIYDRSCKKNYCKVRNQSDCLCITFICSQSFNFCAVFLSMGKYLWILKISLAHANKWKCNIGLEGIFYVWYNMGDATQKHYMKWCMFFLHNIFNKASKISVANLKKNPKYWKWRQAGGCAELVLSMSTMKCVHH
jgi:hypothetical protein